MVLVFDLFSGVLLGLAAGMSPGPLVTLIISETLKHGKMAGIKISLSPFITDIPIALLSLFILKNLAINNYILGIISIFGSLFLLYIAYENFKLKRVQIRTVQGKEKSLQKGIISNFLNPNPYIFWLSVAGPLVYNSLKTSVFSAFNFLIPFYLTLLFSHLLYTFITIKTRSYLKSESFLVVLKLLSAALLLFSFILAKNGLTNLNLL